MNSTRKKEGIFQYLVAGTAACLVFAIMQGIHDNYGIMMNGLLGHTALDYAALSFVVAVGQILYGATQPIFGVLALRRGNAFVMLCGAVLMAAGLLGTPLCGGFWSLLLCFGILLPAGTGALCFGIVMGAITPIIGERRAAFTSGIVQASAGVGDALMSPGLQYMISSRGVAAAMTTFSMPIVLMLPAIIWIGRSTRAQGAAQAAEREEARRESLFSILRTALRDPAYWCLLIGFSTCGFHMSIIETHLFSQYLSYGIPGDVASLTLTVYGVATMLGAMLTGFLGMKWKMKNVLGGVYAVRVLIALGFLFLPKNIPFAFAATAMLGLMGDSTVPPTTGIISRRFGAAKLAIVYGSIFIGHQLGAFASAWLGGVGLTLTGEYTLLWVADGALTLIAALASFAIREPEGA